MASIQLPTSASTAAVSSGTDSRSADLRPRGEDKSPPPGDGTALAPAWGWDIPDGGRPCT